MRKRTDSSNRLFKYPPSYFCSWKIILIHVDDLFKIFFLFTWVDWKSSEVLCWQKSLYEPFGKMTSIVFFAWSLILHSTIFICFNCRSFWVVQLVVAPQHYLAIFWGALRVQGPLALSMVYYTRASHHLSSHRGHPLLTTTVTCQLQQVHSLQN